MSQTPLISLTLLITCSCLVVFGIYTFKSFSWKRQHKEATFPGAGLFYSSPAQITEKYKLNIYPATWLISIIWPVVIFWNIAALIYCLQTSLRATSIFRLPSKIYYLYSGVWFLTGIWTFLFDAGNHTGCATVVTMVTIMAYKALRFACEYFHNYEARFAIETKSKKAMDHPFRYLIIESLGILSMWSTVALGISFSYCCAYKNSQGEATAVMRGTLTSDEGATIGFTFILFVFTVWWVLDLVYWGKASDCIQTIYPSFSLTLFGLFLSNYDKHTGLSLNNILCIGASVLSITAFMSRTWLKTTLSRSSENSLNNTKKSFHVE